MLQQSPRQRRRCQCRFQPQQQQPHRRRLLHIRFKRVVVDTTTTTIIVLLLLLSLAILSYVDSFSIRTTATTTKRLLQHQQGQFFVVLAAKSNNNKRSSSSSNSNSKKGFGGASSNNINNDPSSSSSTSYPAVTSASAVTSTSQNVKAVEQSSILSKKDKERMIQLLQKQYGGITPQDINAGTQRNMERYIQNQPQYIQTAIQLYSTIQQYNISISKLSLYEQMNTYTTQQIMDIQYKQQQLYTIYNEYNINNTYIHNILQQMTWDTSAYAKYVNAQLSLSSSSTTTGGGSGMKESIQQRIITACQYLTNHTSSSSTTTMSTSVPSTKYLDVGCGYGAIIPILLSLSSPIIQPHQITGIDISTEMIKYAKQSHPTCTFLQDDFIQYSQCIIAQEEEQNQYNNDNNTTLLYDGIIFCSSLHDMPNRDLVLESALSLLSSTVSTSRLVIVHAQGANHVQMQHVKNPILVPQLLPTTQELHNIIDRYNTIHNNTIIQLIIEPANPNTVQDNEMGYIAVIEKRKKAAIN